MRIYLIIIMIAIWTCPLAAVTATPEEMNVARQWIADQWIGDKQKIPPFSFILDGIPSK